MQMRKFCHLSLCSRTNSLKSSNPRNLETLKFLKEITEKQTDHFHNSLLMWSINWIIVHKSYRTGLVNRLGFIGIRFLILRIIFKDSKCQVIPTVYHSITSFSYPYVLRSVVTQYADWIFHSYIPLI